MATTIKVSTVLKMTNQNWGCNIAVTKFPVSASKFHQDVLTQAAETERERYYSAWQKCHQLWILGSAYNAHGQCRHIASTNIYS